MLLGALDQELHEPEVALERPLEDRVRQEVRDLLAAQRLAAELARVEGLAEPGRDRSVPRPAAGVAGPARRELVAVMGECHMDCRRP